MAEEIFGDDGGDYSESISNYFQNEIERLTKEKEEAYQKGKTVGAYLMAIKMTSELRNALNDLLDSFLEEIKNTEEFNGISSKAP